MKEIRIIPSKSDAHRALVCAALSDTPCRVVMEETSKDIIATEACLSVMNGVVTDGDNPGRRDRTCVLPCGESGSTLRFLLPVAAALNLRAEFITEGRLGSRPLSPLREELVRHGCEMSPAGDEPVVIEGPLLGGDFYLPGNISSQYVSGLLLALPVLPRDSTVHVGTPVESSGYLDLTRSVIRRFGVRIGLEKNGKEWIYTIPGGQKYRRREEYFVEGDWSNASFFLAAGVLGREPVRVTGLNRDSLQGDKKICDLLREFGAEIKEERNGNPAETEDGTGASGEDRTEYEDVTAFPGKGNLRGITCDCGGIPDMVPVLSLIATQAEGDTRLVNAGRLRLKESDRLRSVSELLNGLGGNVEELDDGLVIHGTGRLKGGVADSFNDHRIAMTAAVASLASEDPVLIRGSRAVEKSYPEFFLRMRELGLDGNLRAV